MSIKSRNLAINSNLFSPMYHTNQVSLCNAWNLFCHTKQTTWMNNTLPILSEVSYKAAPIDRDYINDLHIMTACLIFRCNIEYSFDKEDNHDNFKIKRWLFLTIHPKKWPLWLLVVEKIFVIITVRILQLNVFFYICVLVNKYFLV